jgi:hypothetical protein
MSEPNPQMCCWEAVSCEEFSEWFDSDGRLVKDVTMRQRVFEAGIDPSCRRRLWKFLFEIYPATSTFREQKTIDIENRSQYQALCKRWENIDKNVAMPDDDLSESPPYMELSDDDDGDDSNYCPPRESGLSQCGRSLSNPFPDGRAGLDRSRSSDTGGVEPRHKSPSDGNVVLSAAVGFLEERSRGRARDNGREEEETDRDTVVNGDEAESNRQPKCECDFRRRSWEDLVDEDGRALLSILEFPSRVFAARQPLELETSYAKDKRIVLRDVLRTDRNFHYFSHKRNLRKVHRILLIYAMFHPEMGYAQGMNDLLARFLVVTDSEVDAFWMFERYMKDKRIDFMEASMMRKVALVKKLISEIDRDLYQFFESSECHDYLFCHRWLLLDFKREFAFQDSLRIFEVSSSFRECGNL